MKRLSFIRLRRRPRLLAVDECEKDNPPRPCAKEGMLLCEAAFRYIARVLRRIPPTLLCSWGYIFIYLLLASACQARTITVDDDGLADFNNIQSAINAAKDGDTIIVQPGLYKESINFLGKNITLTSNNPANPNVIASTTIMYIDVAPFYPTVTFRGTEGPNCALIGFDIKGHVKGFDRELFPNGENRTHATISHCFFRGGCMLAIVWCDGEISNCLMVDNNACAVASEPPAINGCHGLIKNCTIVNNSRGPGIAVGSGVATVVNCIIYHNSWNYWAQVFIGNGGTINISYCDIQGGLQGIYVEDPCNSTVNWGPGNIDAEPYFAREGYWDYNQPWTYFAGDYHLRSLAGRWDPNSQTWVKDDVTSLCIDAGDPASPIGLEPFPNGGIINMGAYGGTAGASKSYFGKPPCEAPVAGDINGDCIVNLKDFALIAFHWLEEN